MALERFQAKWWPVRVKKTRQLKNLEPRFDSIETEKALDVAGRDQRAFCFAGVDVDETDMQAGEGLAASHVDGVVNHPRAVGQMAPVPAAEGAGDRDVPDRVV